MKKWTIFVEGMRCGMCKSHVNDAVRRISGVKKVTSFARKKQSEVIAEDQTTIESIANAITSQGYQVKQWSEEPYERKKFFWKN